MQRLFKVGRPFRIFASITLILELVLFALCLWGVLEHRGVPANLGWLSKPRGDAWFISEVDDRGPAFGKLKVGDQLISINGSGRVGRFGPALSLRNEPTVSYTIVVRRGSVPVSLILPVWRQHEQAWRYFSYLLLALINLIVAVWIGAARPDYAAAQVAFFLFMGTARTFAAGFLVEFPPLLGGIGEWMLSVLVSHAWQPLEFAVAYDFSLRFPESFLQPRALRILRGFFYFVALLLFGFSILPALASLTNLPARSALFPPWFRLADWDWMQSSVTSALGAAALLCVPFVLARNYRTLPDPISRRRVRWAALGLGLAILPVAFGISALAVLQLLGSHRAVTSAEFFLDSFASLFSAVAPVALAYAIVKHRILGIAVVVRKSAQYLLARNVLRAILWLPVIAIVIDVMLHPRRPVADFLLNRSWWFYLLLIASASLTLRYRNQLQIWVDRKFFRSAYEEEIIFSELVDLLQTCEDSDQVAAVVAEKLQQSLYPSFVTVLYRKQVGGLFTVGYPQNQAIGLEFRGILNERIQDALQAHRSARTFTEITSLLQEPASTSNGILLNSLLTPISGANGQLIGILLLGEKKSEQSYSSRDRKLLQALAIQMGLIFEMLVLRNQVREEGRVRIEVLGRLDQEHIQLVLECPACGRCYNSPFTHCEIDGNALGFTLPIERIIDGKYRLERRIGTGGMGAVYEASDLRLDRVVAIKVMTGRLFGNHSALRRFEREARVVARLQHPNIVAIFDFGSVRGGGAYLVMQRIAGRSWRTEMVLSGKIRPKRAAVWLDQFCDAVACAHLSGVIHRDLKPENLLVSQDNDGRERITVLDFGVAKLRDLQQHSEPELTSLDRVIGTCGYMSPEQRSGEPVDVRSDVFAVAAVTVEILTNSRPPASGASRDWLKESLRWVRYTAVCDEVMLLLDHALQDSAKERMSSIYNLRHELVPLLYQCPDVLSSKTSGPASADTETMSL